MSSSTFGFGGRFSVPSWFFFLSFELFLSLLFSLGLVPFIGKSSALISEVRGEWVDMDGNEEMRNV